MQVQLELEQLPPHFSHSSLQTYLGCSHSWYSYYILGVKSPPSDSLLIGQAYHHVLEELLRSLADEGILPEGTLSGLCAKHLEEVSNAAGVQPEKPQAILDMLEGLIYTYYKDVLPNSTPVDTELKFEIEVPKLDVPFVGIIDMIEEDGTLVDHKTAAKSWPVWKVDRDIQATAYIFGIWKLTGDIRPFRFDVAVKTSTPKIQVLKTTRTQNQLEWYEELLVDTWSHIRQGMFIKNPTHMWCGERFCAAWSKCIGEWIA